MFSDILLTVDFDRTLTAPDSSIPERNLEAIRFFMANGGAFTVNTGRSVPMYRPLLDVIPVNAPLLLYNGSAAYDPETGLSFCHPIALDLWDTVERLERAFPEVTVELQGVDAHYRFRENPNWDVFCDHNHCTRAVATREMELPFLKLALYGEIRDKTVASMFDGTPEELARMGEIQAEAQALLGDSVEIFRAAGRILDIHARGVSKLRAARELQQRLGRKTLVCVGDGENDLSMLRGADFAFSPADGVVADRFPNVCNCAEGAVADVIYKKIPKILEKNP